MTWRLLCGSALEVLATLPAGSVQCVVTSPPYWGLRDYGTAKWDGGDNACDHRKIADPAIASSTLGGGKKTTGHTQEGFMGDCRRCGARRIDTQIGLEATPAEYVAALVAVFGEVRRVLRDNGVCWLNLGDSYSGGGGFAPNAPCNVARANGEQWGALNPAKMSNHEAKEKPAHARRAPIGLKPKDLIGIPWRVAFALQDDGWYLRSDVIWSKPNPMPESVTDRPTKAHEYVFLLTKSARYQYDADAIADASSGLPSGNKARRIDTSGIRNARTVWAIATEPSPYEHYALMPKALARRCILAGAPMGSTVLDPFAGVCTTGVVALEEGRSFVGVELSPKYHAMGRSRLLDTMPLLAAESA